MLFPKNRLIPVKYIINSQWNFPFGLYPNIKPYPNIKQLGCPAINSTDNKLFYVNSPINFTLKFGIKNDEPYYEYDFDEKLHTPSDKVHEFINKTLTMQYQREVMNIQILLPYAFVTDNKDLTVMTVPPPLDYNNCTFAGGELYIKNWIRHLNLALVLSNNNKVASVTFSVNKPIMMYVFNKQIKLEYTEETDKIKKYLNHNRTLINYRNNIMSLYKDIVSRRPKKLL